MTCCEHCNEFTTNPRFCSRSCSVSYSNKTSPRRKPEGACKGCNAVIKKKNTYCKECFSSQSVDWSKITLGDLREARKHQKNSRVRDLARRTFQNSTKPKQCIVCGYAKHYEVCHIHPISAFPEWTPVTEVNNIDNLVGLCPTHHWEFDNGHLSISEYG